MSATTPIARPMAMPAVPALISGTGSTNAFARPGNMASKPTREVEGINVFIFGDFIIVLNIYASWDVAMYLQNLCQYNFHISAQSVSYHCTNSKSLLPVSKPDIILGYLTDCLLVRRKAGLVGTAISWLVREAVRCCGDSRLESGSAKTIYMYNLNRDEIIENVHELVEKNLRELKTMSLNTK